MGWRASKKLRVKKLAKSPSQDKKQQNSAVMKVGITNNAYDDHHEHPLESIATNQQPPPPSAFTLHSSDQKFGPTEQSLWEMDDDAFLQALSGLGHPFVSTDLPVDVTDAELSKFDEKHACHFSKDHHFDDETCSCTRSISISTLESKSVSEISFEDEEEEKEDQDEESSCTRSINHDVADCRDDNSSSRLYYDVQVPITSDGLLLMLMFNSVKDAVVFEGYAQHPYGSPGPAEQLNLFRNKGDIIVSIEGYTIEGLSFQRTLELLKDLVLFTKPTPHSPQDLPKEEEEEEEEDVTRSSATKTSTTPTIRFRVIDCAPTDKLLQV